MNSSQLHVVAFQQLFDFYEYIVVNVKVYNGEFIMMSNKRF